MSRPIIFNSYTIELTVHTSCFCDKSYSVLQTLFKQRLELKLLPIFVHHMIFTTLGSTFSFFAGPINHLRINEVKQIGKFF